MLRKKSFIVIATLAVSLSFNSCEEESSISLIDSRFSYETPDCDNSGNPEVNCTEWIEFISDSEVDLLADGGDIVQRLSYSINDNRIIVTRDLLSSYAISFEIIDSNTIKRTQDESIWSKE